MGQKYCGSCTLDPAVAGPNFRTSYKPLWLNKDLKQIEKDNYETEDNI